MRVGFAITHPSRGSPGSIVRILEICRQLMRQNVSVSVSSHFSEDKRYFPDINFHITPSIFSSIGVDSASYNISRQLLSSPYLCKWFLERSLSWLINKTEAGIQSFVEQENLDILHAVQPIAGIAAIRITRKRRIPIVVDLHNIWPLELLSQGLIKKDDHIFKELERIEKDIVTMADRITVVSEAMRSYLSEHYDAKIEKIIVVPPAASMVTDARDSSRENRVVYSGMVNYRERVDLFARCLPYVRNNAQFYISSYGDNIRTIRKITNNPNFPKVEYGWFTRREDVINFLRSSKIGIVTSAADETRQMGPPLKLYDYLGCGLPVIANDIGSWSELIAKNSVGLLTSGDPRDFAKCIDYLLDDRQAWETMHQNAVSLIAKEFNWSVIVSDVLIPMYNKLL